MINIGVKVYYTDGSTLVKTFRSRHAVLEFVRNEGDHVLDWKFI